MNLDEFTELATKTEKIQPQLECNYSLLLSTLKLFINSGQILDQFKKNMFYNKPYNIEILNKNIETILEASQDIRVPYLRNELENALNAEKEIINMTKLDSRIIHSIIGACTESTELAETLEKYMENNEQFDFVNLIEEFMDTFWYAAIMADSTNISLDKGTDKVIAKLKARYPEGFTDHHANNRDLETERKILEN